VIGVNCGFDDANERLGQIGPNVEQGRTIASGMERA
jgi:hypothetical protein